MKLCRRCAQSMRREKRRKERESQDNRALADAAAKRIQATIMAVVGDRSSWSVSTRDKWGDGEWTVHVSDNILLYRDFAANRAADIEAALAESAPLESTRDAAGRAAARVLAEMEAILGPDPGDEQMLAQAESTLVAAANGAM